MVYKVLHEKQDATLWLSFRNFGGKFSWDAEINRFVGTLWH